MTLKNIRNNPILLTDVYNLSHEKLKVNTEWETSIILNRAKPMILYGFKEIVTTLLEKKITAKNVEEAYECAQKMNLEDWFPVDMWFKVVNKLDGKVPLQVMALGEGTWVPRNTPFAKISNTVKGFGELVTWWEGVFLQAYFPSTCATRVYDVVKHLKWLQTKRPEWNTPQFMTRVHSFQFRGCRSLEDAYWSGTAWTLGLQGSDDFHLTHHIGTVPISSIPALAHKVVQQFDDEYECYTRAIRQTKDKKIKAISIVIDTYNANRFINTFLEPLALLAEQSGVTIVCRPDSGDVMQQTIRILTKAAQHGLTNVAVIIGEGMNFNKVKEYDEAFIDAGMPLEKIAYGVGGGFYEGITRETLGWAMKTCYSNGKPRMKFSMDEIKRSVPGMVNIVRASDGLLHATQIGENGYLNRTQYCEIYFADKDDQIIRTANLKLIKQRFGKTMLSKDDQQFDIVLSPKTQQLIKELQSKYMLDSPKINKV